MRRDEIMTRAKEAEAEYRHGVWPDADKDPIHTREADIACMGFQTGVDFVVSEFLDQFEELINATQFLLAPAKDGNAMGHLNEALGRLRKAVGPLAQKAVGPGDAK